MLHIERTYGKYFLLAALLIANYYLWSVVVAQQSDGILMVAFLDVGQGDAAFIEAPNGNQMLIDGGPSGQALLRELSNVMPFYDRSIDVLVITNPDKDHVGGFPDILKHYDVHYLLEPGVLRETAVYTTLVSLVESKGVERVFARRGMRIVLGEDVFFDVLFPDRDPKGMTTNDASIVAKLNYGETSFLLTGDTTKKIERYLASMDGKDLDADILKVAHHGSKTSSDAALLGFASPAYAVISSGKGNSYGHPHKEVVDRLIQFGVEIFETAKIGTIIFQSDGTNLLHRK
ncbi:MAG: MBL fold metallo-hydrolase [Parcubacteria group bacterium]|nr:MBL fold metallo-hydrolase [Parcubacteria group bacterium]